MKALLLLLAPVLTFSQNLDLKSLDRLNSKSIDTVDVKLEGSLLQLAAKFLSSDNPDEAGIKKLVAGLTGIYVKTFEFSETGQYADADLDAIRVQLGPPAWSKIMSVKSKKDGENTDIFLRAGGKDQVGGLAIVCAEPKQLSIIQILGVISVEDVKDLAGNFGIPGKLKKESK